MDRAAAEFPCHSQKLRITILNGTLWVEHLTAQPPGGWYPAELGGGEVQRFGLTCDSDSTCGTWLAVALLPQCRRAGWIQKLVCASQAVTLADMNESGVALCSWQLVLRGAWPQ